MSPVTKIVSLVTGLSCSLGGVVAAGVCSTGSNTVVSQVSSPTAAKQVPSVSVNQSPENTTNTSNTDNSSVENTERTEETSKEELSRREELLGEISRKKNSKEICDHWNTMRGQKVNGIDDFIDKYCPTSTLAS